MWKDPKIILEWLSHSGYAKVTAETSVQFKPTYFSNNCLIDGKNCLNRNSNLCRL